MSKKKSALREIIESIIIAIILALIIRAFIVEPFYVPSGSMEPTIMPNDNILVNKFIYRFRDVDYLDLIVFKYPVDPSRDFIKRVIGLGGDEVEISDGQVYINGKILEEDYISEPTTYDYGPVIVPENHFFVLGDNRNNSEDSRYWGFVPHNNIIGQAFLIYRPLNRIRLIK